MLKVFGGRLKQARLKARLSQRDLAERIKVGRATIQRWERGVDLPSIRSILVLGEAVGTSASYLVGFRETPERAVFPDEQGKCLLKIFESLPPGAKVALLESAKDLLQAQKATAKN